MPGSDAESVSSDTDRQLRHRVPHVLTNSTGKRVELDVSGGIGANPDINQFEATASLPRCSDHAAYLRRIHVDGPEKGPGTNGPPEITVVGIYDRLLSLPALMDQATSCVRCGRIQVYGKDPDC